MFVITVFTLILMSSMRATHVIYRSVDVVMSSLEQGFLTCAAFSEHAASLYGWASVRSLFVKCLIPYTRYLNSLYDAKIELVSAYTKLNFEGLQSDITYCASFVVHKVLGVHTNAPMLITLCECYSARYMPIYRIVVVTDYVKRCVAYSSTQICYRTVNVPMYVVSALNTVASVNSVVPCYLKHVRYVSYGVFCIYAKSGLGYVIPVPLTVAAVVYRHGHLIFITVPINLTNTATGLYTLLW